MKNILLFIYLATINAIVSAAGCGQTVYNPYTGKLDCIGTNSGGGGSSSLQVSLGGTQISSPTATINFSSATFTATQSPAGQANISVNFSSVASLSSLPVPGGGDTNVQINHPAGTFYGDSKFQYDSSVSSVTITGKLGISSTTPNAVGLELTNVSSNQGDNIGINFNALNQSNQQLIYGKLRMTTADTFTSRGQITISVLQGGSVTDISTFEKFAGSVPEIEIHGTGDLSWRQTLGASPDGIIQQDGTKFIFSNEVSQGTYQFGRGLYGASILNFAPSGGSGNLTFTGSTKSFDFDSPLISKSTFTVSGGTISINGTRYLWQAGLGGSGQFLQNNNGVITSMTPSGGGGGSPGGSSGQIEYNNAGSFGGIAGSTYITNGSPMVSIQSQSLSTVPFALQGAVGQSGDLQDWNNSAGTNLLAINATGYLFQNGNSFVHDYGSQNFFAGTNAGNFTMTGFQDIGVGYQAEHSMTNGNSNVHIGWNAGYYNDTGNGNTGVGNMAVENNHGGNYNTGVGNSALQGNVSGSNNTALGNNALAPTTGSNNTGVGYFAGDKDNSFATTSGANNTFIGYNSGFNTTTQLNSSVAIGYNAGVLSSNTMVLGGLDVDSVQVAINRGKAEGQLHIHIATSATIGLIIESTSSQTGNLTEWRNSSDVAIASVNAKGNFYASTFTAATAYVFSDGTRQTTAAGSGSSSGVSGAVQFSGGSGAFNSDDADFHWDNGGKELGLGTNSPTAMLDVKPTGSQPTVLKIDGSGTSDAQEWANSSGVALSSVDINGEFYLKKIHWGDGTVQVSSPSAGGGGGTPGGSVNQIQVNRAGSFGGFGNVDSLGDVTIGSFTALTPLQVQTAVTNIPTMTSNSAPSPFAASATSEINSANKAWNAFDNDPSTRWISASGPPQFLKIDLGSVANSVICASYGVHSADDATEAPNTWTFSGSTDDVHYTTLDTQSGITWSTFQTKTYNLSSSTTSYRYFKINVTAINGGSDVMIGQLDIDELGNAFEVTNASATFGVLPVSMGSLTANGTLTATGQTTLINAVFSQFGNGEWLDLPTSGSTGIGSGGVGVNAWLAYTQSGGQWFPNSVAGDINIRNTAGNVNFGNDGSKNARMIMTTTGITDYSLTSTDIPFVIKANASQSADLQDWIDSSGNLLSGIDSNGHCQIGPKSITSSYSLVTSSSSTGIFSMTVSTTGIVSYPSNSSIAVTSCGTSPSVIGSNVGGTITVGSGVSVTACTLTFSPPFKNTPLDCVESDDNTAVTGSVSSLSKTAVTFSFAASLGGGHIYYHCDGND